MLPTYSRFHQSHPHTFETTSKAIIKPQKAKDKQHPRSSCPKFSINPESGTREAGNTVTLPKPELSPTPPKPPEPNSKEQKEAW
jgi:hypothetical protein